MTSQVTLKGIFCERLQIFTHLCCFVEAQQLTPQAAGPTAVASARAHAAEIECSECRASLPPAA